MLRVSRHYSRGGGGGLFFWRGKITSRGVKPVNKRALTEDEQFFVDNDDGNDATASMIAALEHDRRLLEEKQALGEATPEWAEYERDVEEAMMQLESEWLTSAEPITKETVAIARERMEQQVKKIQKKHETKNLALQAKYWEMKNLLQDPKNQDISLPVSKEYAALLEKFK